MWQIVAGRPGLTGKYSVDGLRQEAQFSSNAGDFPGQVLGRMMVTVSGDEDRQVFVTGIERRNHDTVLRTTDVSTGKVATIANYSAGAVLPGVFPQVAILPESRVW